MILPFLTLSPSDAISAISTPTPADAQVWSIIALDAAFQELIESPLRSMIQDA